MLSDKKARHFHAGKMRKVIDDVEYIEVAESNGKVFVSRDGRAITPNHEEPFYPKGNGRWPYPRVRIAGYPATMHRVVYELFVEQIPDGMEIDHINTVCGDSRVDNLRVVTSKANSANPITRKRMLTVLAVSIKAAQKANKKPVIGVSVADGHVVGPFASGREAALAVGVSYKALSQALRGKVKTSAGYIWEEYHDA